MQYFYYINFAYTNIYIYNLYFIVGTRIMVQLLNKFLNVNFYSRVKGVEAVRVVDASIMPQIVTTNIMSTVIAIAEKAADMIREEYSL